MTKRLQIVFKHEKQPFCVLLNVFYVFVILFLCVRITDKKVSDNVVILLIGVWSTFFAEVSSIRPSSFIFSVVMYQKSKKIKSQKY